VEREALWWDDFSADRERPIPYFTDRPDENLTRWFTDGRLRPGRVLELGCGPGRNAIWLAGRGCQVTAVDFSAVALGWARERVAAAAVKIDFRFGSIFETDYEPGGYDLVYDSGCFHHLAPRRRAGYQALVTAALRPGGRFGLVCFRPEGGSGLTDEQVEQQGTLGGGLGYTDQQLRALWDRPPFAVLELEQMRENPSEAPAFGQDFLWTLLAAKQPE
jgi:SAM-dependent methyltransferase